MPEAAIGRAFGFVLSRTADSATAVRAIARSATILSTFICTRRCVIWGFTSESGGIFTGRMSSSWMMW